MARRARSEILFDGCFAHILSRSFEKRWIFQDRTDFEIFKSLLAQRKKDSGFLIHHYCFMNTHIHLLVSIPNLSQFSKAFQKLKWQYTAWYNKRNKRTGPLWRERFQSRLIENERYLYACGLYIEQNPIKAAMVGKPEDWPYSSSAHYALGKEDPLLDPYDQQGLPEGFNLEEESQFTIGPVIGSELFKLQVNDGAFYGVSVP